MTKPIATNQIMPIIFVFLYTRSSAIYHKTRDVYVESPRALVVSPPTYFAIIKALQKFIPTILSTPIPKILANVTSRGVAHDTIMSCMLIMITPARPVAATIQGNNVIKNAFLGDFVACFTKS